MTCWCGQPTRVLNPGSRQPAKCTNCGYEPYQCTCADPFAVAAAIDAGDYPYPLLEVREVSVQP